MISLLLMTALGLAAPSSAKVSASTQGKAIVVRDQLLVLGDVQDWQDFLAKADPSTKEQFASELDAIKELAAGSRSVEELRPVELRLEAWKNGLKEELFPFLSDSWTEPDESVRLAQAQVQAFAELEKLQRRAITQRHQKFLAGLKFKISAAPNEETLNEIFDKAGLSRPAPVAATDLPPSYRGSAAAGSAKGLRIYDVPSPLSLAPADRSRFVGVAAYLRKRGASQKIIDLTIQEAIRQKVDPLIVLSVISGESEFIPGATSPAGARGLMQIMPATGRALGVKNPGQLYNPQTNVRAGISFLKDLWGQFANISFSSLSRIDPLANRDVKKAIAAYNAGPGAVARYGNVPPYRETQNYVVKVLKTYKQLRSVYLRG